MKAKPSKLLSTTDIRQQLEQVLVKIPVKHPQFRGIKCKRESQELNWSKKSIFFELPYWSHNQVKHKHDVMHIEKNVCDSLFGTMLNTEGKLKDTDKVRFDLMNLGIRSKLHLYKDGTVG